MQIARTSSKYPFAGWLQTTEVADVSAPVFMISMDQDTLLSCKKSLSDLIESYWRQLVTCVRPQTVADE